MKISAIGSYVLFFILITIKSSCYAYDYDRFGRELNHAINGIIGTFLSLYDNKNWIYGNGNLDTKNYDFTAQPFNSVVATGDGDIDIFVTNKPGVVGVSISTDSNIMEYINIYVSDQILYLSKKDDINIKPTERKIVVNTGELQSICTHGDTAVVAHNVLADVFHAESHGDSKIDLQGRTRVLSLESSGSSAIKADSFEAKEVDVSSSGSSTVLTRVTEKLNVEVTGSGEVKYIGNPQKVKQSAHGSGKIIHAEL